MLWFLRKAFGVIALAWLVGWLFVLASCFVNPKAAGELGAKLFFFNIVGIPTSIVWAVLKVVSVLGARRVKQPAVVVAWRHPAEAPTSGVLRLETPVPVPEAKRIAPASSTSPPEPDVYTYSAPGMPMCPQCGQKPAIFYCSTHHLIVCLECVAKHDQPGECVYNTRVSGTEAHHQARGSVQRIGKAADCKQAQKRAWHLS